jgi:hypothetical protein
MSFSYALFEDMAVGVSIVRARAVLMPEALEDSPFFALNHLSRLLHLMHATYNAEARISKQSDDDRLQSPRRPG